MARRRLSTLNDKAADLGADIGELSLDNKDDGSQVSSLFKINIKMKAAKILRI
jgi:hypothetical protein